MAARAPQEILEDRTIDLTLNDLSQTCIDSLSEASRLSGTKLYKALNSQTKNNFSKAQDVLLRATEAAEDERDNCLDGKARDVSKMKSLLQKQLTALDNLEEFNGRMQVLESKSVDSTLAGFLTLLVLIRGVNGDLILLEKRMNALAKKTQKAIRATRDAKIKGALGAGFAAIGICLTPLGAGIALVGGIVLVGGELILGQALTGNQESTVKKTWSVASTAGGVADGLGKAPAAFAPAMILATGAVDIAEAFSNQRELDAYKKELKDVYAKMNTLLPKAAKQFKELEKMNKTSQKEMTAAIAAVRSFKPKKGKVHSLPGMLK